MIMQSRMPRVKLAHASIMLAGVLVVAPATAGGIHKCQSGSVISYQTSPCADGQSELAVPPALAAAPTSGGDAMHTALAPASAAAEPRRPARWRPFGRAAIAPGMSDDEVLNTPDGGVPTRIARTRGKGTWREVWTYESRDGGVRELTFTNGTLTSIDGDRIAAAMAPLRVASVAR
jgi:hypothetical protein